MMTMVFAYGLLQPTMHWLEIAKQLKLAHEYYNRRVEIERAKRAAVIADRRALPGFNEAFDELHEIKAKLDRFDQQGKLLKKNGSKMSLEDQEEIKVLKAKRKDVGARLGALKEIHKEELDKIYEKIDADFHERELDARANCGLFWGTYLLVEGSFDQARTAKQVLVGPDGKLRKIKPWAELPDFRSWRKTQGRGLLGVQVQQRMGQDQANLFSGKHPVLRIDPLPENAFDPGVPRGERKRLQRTVLRMRISAPQKKGEPREPPIFGEWPLYMHRPLPAGAKVVGATVLRFPWDQGFEYRWKLQITVKVPAATQRDGYPMVAVNLGWRKLTDGSLRVATWADTDGNTGEVVLSRSEYRDRIEKSESIRSTRDENLNAILPALKAVGVPCSGWKSPRRIYDLTRNIDEIWVTDATDEELDTLSPDELKARRRKLHRSIQDDAAAVAKPWVDRDRHLWWYERGCRTGALNYRKEQYRLFALELAKKYETIIIENYDLRGIVEDEYRIKEPAKQRVEGAPSSAREIFESTGTRLGCRVLMGESKLATQQCHICGCTIRWKAAPRIMHTCVQCGNTWDQDVNNARNLLDRAKEHIEELIAADEAEKKSKQEKGPRFSPRKKKVIDGGEGSGGEE